MMNQLNLLIAFLLIANIYAQDNRILVKGMVLGDSLPIENVHIINISSNRGSLSNKNGEFKISVKENDTLMFSDIQYKIKEIIINNNHIINKKIKVKLDFNTNKLDEIVIFKNKQLTNPLGLPNADKKPLNQIERKLNYYSQESMPIVILAMLLGQKGGIEDLYNIISGNRKKHRKLKSLMDQDETDAFNKIRVEEIRTHFKDDLFLQTLHIPQDNISDYIHYCISKGIINLFEKERYLEIVDIFIKNEADYLQSIQ